MRIKYVYPLMHGETGATTPFAQLSLIRELKKRGCDVEEQPLPSNWTPRPDTSGTSIFQFQTDFGDDVHKLTVNCALESRYIIVNLQRQQGFYAQQAALLFQMASLISNTTAALVSPQDAAYTLSLLNDDLKPDGEPLAEGDGWNNVFTDLDPLLAYLPTRAQLQRA